MHAIDLTLAFGLPGGGEWVILLVLGLLLFGRRLPEVGRSLGRGIVEFKRGIKGIEDEIDEESSLPAKREKTFDAPQRQASLPENTVPRSAETPAPETMHAPAEKEPIGHSSHEPG